MNICTQNKSDIRYFSIPENTLKAVPHGNSPKKNSWWLMEELNRYQKNFIHPSADDLPILLEAKFKKNGKIQVEKFIFPLVDSAINFIKDAGLTRLRLSIVSKKLNMPTIIEVFVYYADEVITYLYRLEDETLIKESFHDTDSELDESLFCIYSATNGKPYKFCPYE